jgi:hypothetical protein
LGEPEEDHDAEVQPTHAGSVDQQLEPDFKHRLFL